MKMSFGAAMMKRLAFLIFSKSTASLFNPICVYVDVLCRNPCIF